MDHPLKQRALRTLSPRATAICPQVLLTRDMARLAPRMDLFRLLHFYHSGLGYFVTARVMMLAIYSQVCVGEVNLWGRQHEVRIFNLSLTG